METNVVTQQPSVAPTQDTSTTQQQEPSVEQGQDTSTTQQQEVNTQLANAIDHTKNLENRVRSDLETKGVNFDEVANEYNQQGALSKETLAKLESAGYPKALVDSYIQNLERTVEDYSRAVYEFVGGQEEYEKLAEYVRTKGDEEVNAVNEVINSGNLNAVKLVLAGLQAERVKVHGTNNKTILGGDAGTPNSPQGFANKQEMITAMRDSRYGKDKEYTKEVESKVIKSNFF